MFGQGGWCDGFTPVRPGHSTSPHFLLYGPRVVHGPAGNQIDKEIVRKRIQEKNYKLTFDNLEIFLDSIHKNIESGVVLVTVLGAFNFCMDLLMLIGSCFDIR